MLSQHGCPVLLLLQVRGHLPARQGTGHCWVSCRHICAVFLFKVNQVAAAQELRSMLMEGLWPEHDDAMLPAWKTSMDSL
jgi:hypothetical protein